VSYRGLATVEEIGPLCQAIATDQPELIGFAATSCQFEQLKEVIRACAGCRKRCWSAGNPSHGPAGLPGDIPALDAIVRGEGNSAAGSGERVAGPPGLFAHSESMGPPRGAVVRNELRPLIADLDALPFPDLDLAETQRAIDEQLGCTG